MTASTEIIAAKIKEGDLAGAVRLADEALARDATNPQVWYLKGKAYAFADDTASSITSYNTAIKHKADFKEAYFDLATQLEKAGQLATSAKVYEFWLKLEQSSPPRKNSVSSRQRKKIAELFSAAQTHEHRNQFMQAVDAYTKVLQIDADLPEALLNLGNALYRLERYSEAQHALLHCIRVSPRNAFALNSLGMLYRDTANAARCIAAFRQALAADPDYVAAAINLGNVFHELKEIGEERRMHEKVLSLTPNNNDIMSRLAYIYCQFCEWEKAAPLKARIKQIALEGKTPVQPFTLDTLFDDAGLQLHNTRNFTAQKYPSATPYDAAFAFPSPAGGKLRIGYLSADFHEHATAYLIAELFEHHDRAAFEVYAYSYGVDDGSATRQRLQGAVERFCDIRDLSDDAAVERIRADQIDILIDLKGYTLGHRMGIMSSRPAPLQIHYLGFPATLGASFIDYFIADAITCPKGREGDFSERVISLPHSYQMNDRKRPLPAGTVSRSDYGLPKNAFIFCDFNNAYKITPEVFAIWMKLLRQTEASILWLHESHAETSANLRMQAEKAGIDPARLFFVGKAPLAEHIQRYGVADLFIDTSPVCGHTTASDALWAGLPVLTYAGDSFIARVAPSLLHAVNLSGLVAGSWEEYEAKALELSCAPEKLAAMRQHLEENRMKLPLFDSAATTKALEAAYLHAAKLHREKIAPKPFAVADDLSIAD